MRIAAYLLNSTVALANVLLAISFLVQGVGFNFAFFAHADTTTLALASVAFRPLLLTVLGYFVLVLVCPFFLGNAAQPMRRSGVIAAAVAGVALNAPAWSLAWYVGGAVADLQSALWVPKPVVQLSALPPKSDARSLVLIFAESLEATYSRADLFGEDLTPRLTRLAASGTQFTNMHQVSRTASTTGGLVAAQCARALTANAWWQLPLQGGASAKMEGTTCLGDLLTAHGYRTVFMTGIDIHFGGIEAFHAAHGFVERLGFEALSSAASADGWTPANEDQQWMIEDEAVFALVRSKTGELAAKADPFALVMTTMDTHGPSGFPSASCGAADGMIATVRCADRLIADFVDDIRSAYPDVVVALMTDHLVGPSGVDDEVKAVLDPRDQNSASVSTSRRIPAMISRRTSALGLPPERRRTSSSTSNRHHVANRGLRRQPFIHRLRSRASRARYTKSCFRSFAAKLRSTALISTRHCPTAKSASQLLRIPAPRTKGEYSTKPDRHAVAASMFTAIDFASSKSRPLNGCSRPPANPSYLSTTRSLATQASRTVASPSSRDATGLPSSCTRRASCIATSATKSGASV